MSNLVEDRGEGKGERVEEEEEEEEEGEMNGYGGVMSLYLALSFPSRWRQDYQPLLRQGVGLISVTCSPNTNTQHQKPYYIDPFHYLQ